MENSSQQASESSSEKYSLYGDMLFRICMVYLGSKEDVEEVMRNPLLNSFIVVPSLPAMDMKKHGSLE